MLPAAAAGNGTLGGGGCHTAGGGTGFFEEAAPIVLPRLRDRPEDLRSIVADRLAREGLRVHGRPIGIEAAAFARLVEYPFDGEDAELASIVTRLVARVEGEVIRAADVDALALVHASEAPSRSWPEGTHPIKRVSST